MNPVSIKLYNHNVQIFPEQCPRSSESTKMLFETAGFKPPASFSKLQNRILSLQTVGQKLENAKNHSVRDKIIGLLAAALIVSVAVGGVLGTIAMSWCPPAAVGIGLASGFLYAGLAAYFAHRVGCEGHGNYAAFIGILIAGPFFPIYEAFSKIPNLEDKKLRLKNKLEKEIPDFIDFLEKNQDYLKRYLQQEQQRGQTSLKVIQQAPMKTEAWEREIADRISTLEAAQRELDEALLFYLPLKSAT